MNHIDNSRSVRESNQFSWLIIVESIKILVSIIEREVWKGRRGRVIELERNKEGGRGREIEIVRERKV